MFVIAAALRLARFNTMLEDPDRPAWHGNFFTGMPAPAGAIVGLLPLYVQLSSFVAPGTRLPVGLDIGFVILVAFLMASRIPFFSGKTIGRIPRERFMAILFAVAATLLLLATFPMEMMILLAVAYLATTPFAIRRWRRYERGSGGACRGRRHLVATVGDAPMAQLAGRQHVDARRRRALGGRDHRGIHAHAGGVAFQRRGGGAMLGALVGAGQVLGRGLHAMDADPAAARHDAAAGADQGVDAGAE